MSRNVFGSSLSHRPGGTLAAIPTQRPFPLPSPSRALAGLVVAAGCVLMPNGAGFAQTIDEDLWVTDEAVHVVVRGGGTFYIGGSFHQVGPGRTGPRRAVGAPHARRRGPTGAPRRGCGKGRKPWGDGRDAGRLTGARKEIPIRIRYSYSYSLFVPVSARGDGRPVGRGQGAAGRNAGPGRGGVMESTASCSAAPA